MAFANKDVTIPIRSKIWYSDGSVVIQAENTQFRVHASVLSQHSTMFNDMFGLAKPSDETRVEGCPLVTVTDTATDWAHVLTTLYDYNFHQTKKKPFAVVAAMLRLGRKYGFDSLYTDAKSRLTIEFPTKLNDITTEYTCIEDQKSLIVDVVNLAREIGVLSILPFALYSCCFDSDSPGNHKDVICGERRNVGSIVSLSEDDKNACLLACPSLLQAQFDHTLAWLDISRVPSPRCRLPHQCEAVRTKAKLDTWVPVPVICALDTWEECRPAGLCDGCVEVAKDAHETGVHEVWSLLPSFFGLPPWEELKLNDLV